MDETKIRFSTNALQGKRRLKHVSSQEYINWAMNMLEEGNDEESIVTLAGSLPLEDTAELGKHFDKAIEKLGQAVGDKEAILIYAKEVAQAVLDQKITCEEGASVLHQIFKDTDDHLYFIWLQIEINKEELYRKEPQPAVPELDARGFEEAVREHAKALLEERSLGI